MTRKFKEHDQLDLFGQSLPDFKPKGKLRLIELFAGIGAQSKALENLGVEFASQRVCEWSWKSIIGYNAIHKRDFSDHSEGMSVDDLVKATEGISNDYSNPMTEAERKRKGEAWLRRVYSSMVAIGDTVPSITMLRGSDLGIERERESRHVRDDLFVPMPRPVQRGQDEGNGKGKRHKVRASLGSRKDTA